MALYHKFGEII